MIGVPSPRYRGRRNGNINAEKLAIDQGMIESDRSFASFLIAAIDSWTACRSKGSGSDSSF